jgi:NAD(P)-dependent dehydrogenase (short-subunit alcohol dehydrogenase family)
MDINNKVALVTGGASGLGKATVQKLIAEGASVAIFDLNEQAGAELCEELGEKALFVAVNVADEASVMQGIKQVMEAFGAIHICLNYAGIANAIKTYSSKGPFPLDQFTHIININLVGTFNVLRLAAEQMAKNEPLTDDGERGVIINTASVAAYEGQIGQAAYSASKGGIVGMTLPIARDLSTLGIRVNTIVPGLIHTPLFNLLPEDAFKSLESSVLYPKRLGRPEEIAHLATSIIENGYINGECIRMDGGIRMQPR